MPEKDPTNYGLLTYGWVLLLSAWGGLAAWIRKRNEGTARPFNFMELVGEIVISAFAGLITFFLGESAGLNSLVTAALVGVSGHMGSRAIFLLESWAEKRFAGAKT